MSGTTMETTKALMQPRSEAVDMARNDMELGVERVIAQTHAIQRCMQAVMKSGTHFGVIEGTDKPTLFQPGADKLCVLFWLRPEFRVTERAFRDDYIMYEVTCVLKHRKTGEEWGEGVGAANSREKKYIAQTTQRSCPTCKKPTIFRSKRDGGWFCWEKKGGCGAQFKPDNQDIVNQTDGVAKQEAVHDLQNNLLKMAAKRAKVAAILSATAASDIFTQDLEDLEEQMYGGGEDPSPAAASPKPANGGHTQPSAPRPNPRQIADLNMALGEHTAVVDSAKAAHLKGDARQEAITSARIEWVNAMLATKDVTRQVKSFVDLAPAEALWLIECARAGAMPSEEA